MRPYVSAAKFVCVAQNERAQNVIVVEGRGSVEVSPDIALLQVNLETNADSAGEALSLVSNRAAAVTSAVRDHHIGGEDLKTTGLNVFPQMDQGGLRVHHYRAFYGFRVRLRDISRAPLLIESISTAAGDALRLGGIQTIVSDPEGARSEAGVRAVADARQRAARLADAAGVRLRRILSITEGQAAFGHLPRAAMAASTSLAGQPPIQAGSEEITVQVTVTFEIGS
jgi:uncharacterized protein